jgi:hypothetical protein
MNDQNSQDVTLPSVDTNQVSAPAPMAPATPAPYPAPAGPLAGMPMQQPQGQSMQQVIAASLPLEAHDLDLIEKTWVEKAKAIVARTHGDPYLQNKALSQVKADYIRKRYGRDIKVSE